MAFLAGSGIVAAVTAYQLGYFDRPEFEITSSLCRNTSSGLQFIGVIAISTEGNISSVSDRLDDGVLKGIRALENGDSMLKRASDLYGTPKDSDKVRLSLFGDDIEAQDGASARWGAGWAVAVAKFRDIQKVIENIQGSSGLNEEIRAVRVEGPGVLKATIPWRNNFTPVVGAMIQWGRAYDAFAKHECTADNGRDGQEGTICMEMSVCVADDRIVWVDFVLLHNDTSELWDDAFPEKVSFSVKNSEETGDS